MAPELENALSFRLPNGKTLRDTSSVDWYAYYELQLEMLEMIEEKAWLELSAAERAYYEAICERAREFADAVETVIKHTNRR